MKKVMQLSQASYVQYLLKKQKLCTMKCAYIQKERDLEATMMADCLRNNYKDSLSKQK